jgi:hypothetical protein
VRAVVLFELNEEVGDRAGILHLVVVVVVVVVVSY